jgi:hypothetical protein
MTAEIPEKDKKYLISIPRVISAINPTRLILGLIAITIVSFVIGSAVLFLSGGMTGTPDEPVTPFKITGISNTTVIPLEGVSSGKITFIHGAGIFGITGGASGNDLLEATIHSSSAIGQPEISTITHGQMKIVSMTDKGQHSKEFPLMNSKNRWDIRLNEQVPIGLDVTVGAGECSLALGTLNLTALNVNSGVGELEIDLGGYHGGRFDTIINSGVGDLTITVPSGSNTRITAVSGLGDLNAYGLELDNGAYVTPGYDPTGSVNEIQVTHHVGALTLKIA